MTSAGDIQRALWPCARRASAPAVDPPHRHSPNVVHLNRQAQRAERGPQDTPLRATRLHSAIDFYHLGFRDKGRAVRHHRSPKIIEETLSLQSGGGMTRRVESLCVERSTVEAIYDAARAAVVDLPLAILGRLCRSSPTLLAKRVASPTRPRLVSGHLLMTGHENGAILAGRSSKAITGRSCDVEHHTVRA
jgi:hypothetical protein